MRKKFFLILILPVLALVGAWFLRGVFATSNPHSWTNGLVGYWSFDGQYTTSTDGTRDVSNNGNWGAFNGGVKPVAGVSGQALSFDGVDDYVNAGSDASLNFLNKSAITVEAWVKNNTLAGGSDTIVSQMNTSGLGGFWLGTGWLTVNKAYFAVDIGGVPYSATSAVLSTGTYYHLVGIYDGSNVRIYVNGVEGTPSPVVGVLTAPNHSTLIGAWMTNGYYWDGIIDEVRIYNRALSADEVKQHYDQTKRNFVTNTSNPNTWTNGLVGYWNFDGQNTTSTNGTRDTSGNNNWGTFSGGVKPVAGISGQALSFDGVDDYVNMSQSANLSGGGSVEAWINPKTLSSVVIWDDSWAPDNLVGLWIASNKVNFYYYTGSYLNIRNSLTLSTNTWYHVVATWDSGAATRKIYVNGELNTQEAGSQWYVSSGMRIGTRSGADGFFNGLIDEVRIYNRALSADEVKQHYDQTKRNFVTNTSNPNAWTNGLVGYWPFDGQYTTSTDGTKDVSDNGNYGQFKNGVKPVAGVVGQALYFDGVNDYVNLGTNSSLQPTSAFTLEAWVKPLASGSYEGMSNFGYSYPDKKGFRWTLWNDGTVLFQMGNGTNRVEDWSVNHYSQNVWVHLVATYDGTTMRQYFNGVVDANTATLASPIVYNDTTNRLGWEAATEYGNVVLDEVRIYNRTLSADEVMEHYQQTRRNLGM